MTTTVAERADSRQRTKGDNPQTRLRYNVDGTDDDAAVFTALLGAAPSSYDSLPRRSYSIDPVGPNLWLGEVVYRNQSSGGSAVAPPTTGDVAFTFDTTGGTAKTYFSLETISAHGGTSAGSAGVNDNGRLINCNADTVDGVDVVTPQFTFQRTLYRSTCSGAYIGSLYDATGCTNNASWTVTTDDGGTITFAAGEVLFLGARGGKQGGPNGDLWEVTQLFAASPNRTGIAVGGITGIAKRGWEYLWVRYIPAIAGSLGIPTQKAAAAYVERVYDEADFGSLD